MSLNSIGNQRVRNMIHKHPGQERLLGLQASSHSPRMRKPATSHLENAQSCAELLRGIGTFGDVARKMLRSIQHACCGFMLSLQRLALKSCSIGSVGKAGRADEMPSPSYSILSETPIPFKHRRIQSKIDGRRKLNARQLK